MSFSQFAKKNSAVIKAFNWFQKVFLVLCVMFGWSTRVHQNQNNDTWLRRGIAPSSARLLSLLWPHHLSENVFGGSLWVVDSCSHISNCDFKKLTDWNKNWQCTCKLLGCLRPLGTSTAQTSIFQHFRKWALIDRSILCKFVIKYARYAEVPFENGMQFQS